MAGIVGCGRGGESAGKNHVGDGAVFFGLGVALEEEILCSDGAAENEGFEGDGLAAELAVAAAEEGVGFLVTPGGGGIDGGGGGEEEGGNFPPLAAGMGLKGAWGNEGFAVGRGRSEEKNKREN